MPYRYFIQLAFDGAGFSGWQMQPNALTVQSVIEQGIGMIAGVFTGVTGCGRTDAGVHARLFYAHFDVDEPLKNPEQLAFKLNRFLPPSIAIHAIVPVIPGSHSRFSAIWREYRYTLISKKDPFLFSRASLVAGTLDLDLMNRGAQLLLEYPDFECFSKVKTQVSNFNCRILEAEWMAIDHVMEFHVFSEIW
jgi:tRNA pseudouridine38-40 synthase